ncbi:MAG: hypothetical protein KJ970_04255 [Candidatus Eisenbacteria bacterium]|uniref:PorV/PorQ family protein n=1 Tax=Eiseniibacteriota bacterium TaxID=2212470 RepID=A0A948RW66_UNCEI|nr:hypothetical protein [Candidatus Eisenbacteria bacterium]MBU1948022.1 hypothetical protein [Candidatus Eisenbacteria bacterium]MBU2690117.1 hypothetical protein [Candidatus Eisenbacteria bacterium]
MMAERNIGIRRLCFTVLLVVFPAVLLSPRPAGAYFEKIHAGARATGMGGAYSALVDDASAAYWNPAALVTLQRGDILLMYAKPYAISNLQSSYMGFALPRNDVSVGLSWHHTGISGVMGENLITLGLARDLLAPGGRYACSVGGNLKLAHVGYDSQLEKDYGQEVHFTGDIGTLLSVGRRLSLSYVARNLGEPRFNFAGSGGGTILYHTQDLGVAYRWNPSSTVTGAYTREASGEWTLHAGGEVWFYDVFGLRTGFSINRFSGGAGLKTGRYLVDVAFETHNELGASYEVSLRIPFGGSRW